MESIDPTINNNCNLLLLFQEGKRVFVNLDQEGIKKTVLVSPPRSKPCKAQTNDQLNDWSERCYHFDESILAKVATAGRKTQLAGLSMSRPD